MDQQGLLNFFTKVSDFIWGYPLMILLVGTGLFLTISLMARNIDDLGPIVTSGLDIISPVFVDSGILFSATTLLRMSLSVIIPTGFLL